MNSATANILPSVANVATHQSTTEASNFAKETVGELNREINDRDFSLRLLGLLAGVVLVILSVFRFLGDFLSLHWIDASFHIYVFILGIVMIILESENRLTFLSHLEACVHESVPFLKKVWGRGLLYVIAGTILISFNSFVEILLGCFVCLVGGMYIWVGRITSQKVAESRGSRITSEQLQEQFAMADIDGMGSLTKPQFKQLSDALGLNLNKRETEVAFLQIDSNQSGRLTYEAVYGWWNKETNNNASFAC